MTAGRKGVSAVSQFYYGLVEEPKRMNQVLVNTAGLIHLVNRLYIKMTEGGT